MIPCLAILCAIKGLLIILLFNAWKHHRKLATHWEELAVNLGIINELLRKEITGGVERSVFADVCEDRDDLLKQRDNLKDGIELAWGIIANVGRGNWEGQNDDWLEAVRRWESQFMNGNKS